MNPTRWFLAGAVALLLLGPPATHAFPPSPHHLFYGIVRNEWGDPLDNPAAEVILETAAGVKIKTTVVPGLDPGVNYKLAVPMDAGLTADPYRPTALRPTMPFKIRVRIGQSLYLPIEMSGDYAQIGQPGQKTRLNLTLGEDADGDGLPDAWERALIAQSGQNQTLKDVRSEDDFDGDGLSNLQEYLAGTYAFDPQDGFTLKAIGAHDDVSVLEFLAIAGRTYSVLASADLQTWGSIPFRLVGPAAPTLQDYRATDVRQLQVEVKSNPADPRQRFFKLMVR